MSATSMNRMVLLAFVACPHRADGRSGNRGPGDTGGNGGTATHRAVAEQPQLAAAVATALPGGGSPSTMVLPKIATTTVSRGDSLWRLSRLRYGVGTRYAVIYKANRDQIRNPNLIHPGQIFVLPAR